MSNIFHEARPQSAFLKMGIYGEAGTGKSFTSSLVAIGLHKFIKSDKPVFYMDTETGTDFLRERFAAANINLMVAKTRAFADLITAIDGMQEGSILIIDSLTHYWNELIESYLKKNQKTRLTLRDWQPLKGTWHEYSDRFVNSKLHIIVAGRSADKWGEVEEEDGTKEIRKTGTKMRAEGEFTYEPSLLVEMELFQVSAKIGANLIHRAHVKKDRFDIVNGQHFDDPTFETFLPHISKLNLGGEHLAIETDRNSQAIFDDPNLGERRAHNKEILSEEISNEVRKLFPSQSKEDVAGRIALFEEIFGTNSWTKISQDLKNDVLSAGLNTIRAKVHDASTLSAAVAEKPSPLVCSDDIAKKGDGKKQKGARA